MVGCGRRGVGCRVPALCVLSLTTPSRWHSESADPKEGAGLPSPNCICLSSRALRDPRGQWALQERWDPR